MAGQLFIQFKPISKGVFKKLLISKAEAISGKDIQFEKVDLFGLNPGTEVKTIGDGRENGCVRTDDFTIPHKYVGRINIDGEENYAFQVPNNLTNNAKGADPELNYYLVYQRSDEEVYAFRHVGNSFYIRWYKPVFVPVISF